MRYREAKMRRCKSRIVQRVQSEARRKLGWRRGDAGRPDYDGRTVRVRGWRSIVRIAPSVRLPGRLGATSAAQ